MVHVPFEGERAGRRGGGCKRWHDVPCITRTKSREPVAGTPKITSRLVLDHPSTATLRVCARR